MMDKWRDLNDNGNLKAILKDGETLDHRANEALQALQNDYIDNFGVSKDYKRRLQKEIQLELMELEFIQTGNRSMITFINIAKRELEEMNKTKIENKASDSKLKIAIERFLGFRLNLKETSVFDFYSYANELKNG